MSGEPYKKAFRYTLEPYRAGQKHVCPQCGRKSLVLYVDTATGGYVDETVGRCDHELGCGYHLRPKEFFDSRGMTAPAGDFTPLKEFRLRKDEPTSYVYWSRVKESMERMEDCDLYKWLSRRFGSEATKKYCGYYKLGYSDKWGGACIYWQIDSENKVRTGKIMQYDPLTGHRVKEPEARVAFVHKMLPKSSEFVLRQCFYGEHLVPGSRKPICIVESEKTALIAAICLRGYTWIATGGLNNLSAEKCKVLEGHEVILFPDLEAEDRWKAKAADIPQLKDAKVSMWLREHSTEDEIGRGLDIGDFLADNRDGWKQLKAHLEDICRKRDAGKANDTTERKEFSARTPVTKTARVPDEFNDDFMEF